VKFFKTKLYQNISDFKKLFINDKNLEKSFLKSRIFSSKELNDTEFNLQKLTKSEEYIWEQLKSFGFKEQDLKAIGYISIKEFEKLGYKLYKLDLLVHILYGLESLGYVRVDQIIHFLDSEYDLTKLKNAGYNC
ncbi:MAG: DUF2963 domain-containing protein, partial [Candidatus Phytoplasma sp. TWB_XP]